MRTQPSYRLYAISNVTESVMSISSIPKTFLFAVDLVPA